MLSTMTTSAFWRNCLFSFLALFFACPVDSFPSKPFTPSPLALGSCAGDADCDKGETCRAETRRCFPSDQVDTESQETTPISSLNSTDLSAWVEMICISSSAVFLVFVVILVFLMCKQCKVDRYRARVRRLSSAASELHSHDDRGHQENHTAVLSSPDAPPSYENVMMSDSGTNQHEPPSYVEVMGMYPGSEGDSSP